MLCRAFLSHIVLIDLDDGAESFGRVLGIRKLKLAVRGSEDVRRRLVDEEGHPGIGRVGLGSVIQLAQPLGTIGVQKLLR